MDRGQQLVVNPWTPHLWQTARSISAAENDYQWDCFTGFIFGLGTYHLVVKLLQEGVMFTLKAES